MPTFVTRNSSYEYDPDRKLIRRIEGSSPPTEKIGEDGAWRPYARLLAFDWEADDPSPPEVGCSALIVWPDGTGTLTTVVSEVQP